MTREIDRPDDPPFVSFSEARRLAHQISSNYDRDFEETMVWLKSGITRREFFEFLLSLRKDTDEPRKG